MTLRSLAGASTLALLTGCSNQWGGRPACGGCARPTPYVQVDVVGGVGEGLQSLTVEVTKVEVQLPAGWVTLTTQPWVFDALAVAPPSTGATLPLTGSLTALRLTFGARSRAVLADGSTVSLPSPQPVMEVPVDVPMGLEGGSVHLALVLDPGLSVHRREGGYAFFPELRATDYYAPGRIQGQVLNAAGQPLPGVVVTAQSSSTPGEPRLLRRALTGADGRYSLAQLPAGTACHAVTWIAGRGGSYAPQASAAFTPTSAAPSATADFRLTARTDTATLQGLHAPAAGTAQAGIALLGYGAVNAGGNPQFFFVGATPTLLEGGQERHAFAGLPQGGAYQVRGRRRSWDANGHVSEDWRRSPDLGVLAGVDATANLVW